MYKTITQQLLITTDQLVRANAESIRLGFNRTLNLPPDFPRLTFPVHEVWQDNDNVRLTILFWESVQAAASGKEPEMLILDVTKDWFAKLEKSSRRIMEQVRHAGKWEVA